MGKKSSLLDLIIIGGSGAACAAGVYAARSGLKTMVITDSFGGQLLLTESIENYPGYIYLSGLEMSKKLEEHLKSYKEVQVQEGEKVTKLEKTNKGFKATIESGKEFESLAVIIATGKRPKRMPNVKGFELFEKGKGITYCAICDGPLYKGKDVAVIGGGYAGVEEALYLSDLCPTIYLIEYTDHLSGEQITIDEVLKRKNIKIFLNSKVTEFFGEKFVQGVRFEDMKAGNKVKEIKIFGAFINVGQIPNTEFVPSDVAKEQNGAIKINLKCETNIPGLFAAGDATNTSINQLVVSAAEGCRAALAVNDYVKRVERK
ncbi:MAG: FAD-dependent oxidoreductase [archaeon]|nr:FAD-dependent oxidoreductase [archaeon]